MPVTRLNKSKQEDVDQWPYLRNSVKLTCSLEPEPLELVTISGGGGAANAVRTKVGRLLDGKGTAVGKLAAKPPSQRL